MLQTAEREITDRLEMEKKEKNLKITGVNNTLYLYPPTCPLHPSIPTHLFPLLVFFFCWRLLVSNNQKPLSVGRISLAPPQRPPLSLLQLSPLDQGDVYVVVHVCVCCGGWVVVRACAQMCMLQVACTCIDRSVGCTILGGGGGGVSYQDSASGDRQERLLLYTPTCTRAHTHTHLNKRAWQ